MTTVTINVLEECGSNNERAVDEGCNYHRAYHIVSTSVKSLQ